MPCRAVPCIAQIEKAFDMAQEVESLFTNFDSSVYTIIFIPADASGVLPPGAEKYLKQVRQNDMYEVFFCMRPEMLLVRLARYSSAVATDGHAERAIPCFHCCRPANRR